MSCSCVRTDTPHVRRNAECPDLLAAMVTPDERIKYLLTLTLPQLASTSHAGVLTLSAWAPVGRTAHDSAED